MHESQTHVSLFLIHTLTSHSALLRESILIGLVSMVRQHCAEILIVLLAFPSFEAVERERVKI